MKRFWKTNLIILVVIMLLTQMTSQACNVEKDKTEKWKNTATSIENRLNSLMESMTLDEKAGQMLQSEMNATPDDVKKYSLGSVFSGADSYPGDNKKEDWIDMCKKYQDAAMSTRLGIPIMFGIDAIHGHNAVNGTVIFPHNIGLGAAGDTELMSEIAGVTASEMIATGVNWDFGPCIAVARDERWGRTLESYSEDPKLVSKLLVPFIKTMQDKYGITATAKHYAADGGTGWNTEYNHIDRLDANISEEELRKIHIAGYEKAVKAGVKTVMVSFSSWNGVCNHENKYLIQDVLKGELGFKGFVVSDYEGIHMIMKDNLYDQVVAAVNAGIDMLMEPMHWKETIDAIKEAVNKGDIKEERINDAVRRILRVKLEMGLFEKPLGNQNLAAKELGSSKNREIAKKAVRESLVLLKNKNNILPLKKGAKIFVTGPAADNVGIQCGGWTVSWQGGMDNNGIKWTQGSTILEGFKKIAEKNGGTIITDEKEAKNADVAVVVIGEKPYAEYEGDDGDLGLYNGLALDGNQKALETAKATGLPVVTILVSGRPRIVTDEIKDWDAFVAAWLPGSEGDAVAEVLYGKYPFTGKLSFTWPADVKQLPINVGDKSGKIPLFPYGFGLKTSNRH
ncbi:MAG: glycoside hydrolase family 3 protein [Bacillota bacterium]|nr:glycoside hydrolase family 3 protein [Bacillota bacterium]